MKLGEVVSTYLSEYLETEVHIGSINAGLLNQLVINDVVINDKSGEKCLVATKANATIEILPLLKKDIIISSLQLSGLSAITYKDSEDSPLNIQFIINKLSSKESDAEKHQFKIESLVVKNSNLQYDKHYKEKSNSFDINHIDLSNLELVANIHSLDTNNINVDVKKLSFTEKNSSVVLNDLSANISNNDNIINIKHPVVNINSSILKSDSITIDLTNSQAVNIQGNLFDTSIIPSDFYCLSKDIPEIEKPLLVSTNFEYTPGRLILNDFKAKSQDQSISVDGSVELSQNSADGTFADVRLNEFSIDTKELPYYLSFAGLKIPQNIDFLKLGVVKAIGDFKLSPDKYSANTVIKTSIGDIKVDGDFTDHKLFKGHVETSSLHINQALSDTDLKEIAMNMDVDFIFTDKIHEGTLRGNIMNVEYKQYAFQNIKLDGNLSDSGYKGLFEIEDPKLDMTFDGMVQGIGNKNYVLNASINVNHFQPSSLGLDGEYANNNYEFIAKTDIQGNDLNNLSGTLDINNLKITTSITSYTLDNIYCEVNNYGLRKDLLLKSDIISGEISGEYEYTSLFDSFMNIPNAIMPLFGKDFDRTTSTNDSFEFSLTANNHPFLQTVIKERIDFNDPIDITGFVNVPNHYYLVESNLPSISYDNKTFDDIHLGYESNIDKYSIALRGVYNNEERIISSNIKANGNSEEFQSVIDVKVEQDNPIEGTLNIDGSISKSESNDHLAHITLKPSELAFMNHQLNIEADYIDIFNDHLNICDFKVENEDKSLTVNGVLSKDSADCLIADLNGTKMESLFDIAGTKVSDIDGFVYGKCQVYDILSSPKINANLTVQDLVLKNNSMGNAYVLANWDREQNVIDIHTQIIGEETSNGNRQISADGYIDPSNNSLDLNIDCINVDAALLNGLIGRTFKDIAGNINGKIGVRGPLENIQMLGELKTDASITLRATNVTYYISPDDIIKIGSNYIVFEKIHVSDYDGHTNIIDGFVTHKGFKDFTYKFDMNFSNMLAYEESTYNSDKFMGKVYGDGELHINGADGHPVYINIDITPAPDSEFYYDASTPDAITGNSFISFKELAPTDSILLANNVDPGWYWSVRDSVLNSSVDTPPRKYRGDLFVNIGIHMNHNCPIKLRMDSADDAYITIYGTGTLRAEYYNKGTFSLNGTYNIQDGKYRLYLQDIIYRDLIIQNGSNVVFNGNPFDADIHLLCWYTLNSVPLSDLTSVSYTQNNRVKVICMLDITGNLGNMMFNFDLNLPNVSDETRQIVRSYISTEEEMNKQMIYLLGFGRFFTNEYARVNGESNTNQAVNNLLSSTLSGQINQILSNAVGSDSKWNFGTGLSTGERGWEDMDVEGTLSGKLLDDRLLINGNFGYRDNSMTNNSSFVGDFDVKWRLTKKGNTYLKAYNLTNDRYFTKSTLNTQGIGVSFQKDFESWTDLIKSKKNRNKDNIEIHTDSHIIPPDSNKQEIENILILRNDTTN